MPMVSKAQNRFFRWADEHPEEAQRERGLKPGVAEKFITASHGEKVSKLPERVQKKAHGGAVRDPSQNEERAAHGKSPAVRKSFRW